MSILSCAEMDTLGPELAIGTLMGDERASALVHLEGCARCRQMVDELAPVADDLLLLAPEAEPPIGFESRTAARIAAAAALPAAQPTPLRRPAARRRLIAVAAAAFVVGALGAGTVAWWAADRGSGTHVASPVVRTAIVRQPTKGGQYSCHAMVVGTKPVWLYLSVTETGGTNTTYRVEALSRTSAIIPIGTVELKAGKGALGIVLRNVQPTDLTELHVFDMTGALRYSATFSTVA